MVRQAHALFLPERTEEIPNIRETVAMDLFTESTENTFRRQRLVAICFSLAVGATLMGVKFYAYYLTRSTAILSDALESIINVVAGFFAMWSIIVASRPPDPDHPYGHGKIEYFSAGFEGALIVIAAVGIVYAAIPQIMTPHGLPNLDEGLFILLATSLVNLVLAIGLLRVGRHTRSIALVADGKHILTDVYTSAGVLLGLLLVNSTGWYWMDGAIACVMALNILFMGARLIRRSFAGLMDESDPKLLEEISRLIAQHRRESWIDVHHLRAWRSGNRIHADFHLILPRDLSLEETHIEVTQLQQALKSHIYGMGDVLIHAEPCIEPECPICGMDPCNLRGHPVDRQHIWLRDTLTSGPLTGRRDEAAENAENREEGSPPDEKS